MSPSRRIILKNFGMFSQVGQVLEALDHAERHGFRLYIDWPQSLFRDNHVPGPVWEYWFEQPYHDWTDEEIAQTEPFTLVLQHPHHLVLPTLFPNTVDPLLLPANRPRAQELFNTFIRLQPEVRARLEEARKNLLSNSVIGLHMRGAGGLDGGLALYRRKLPCVEGVPYQIYFEAVDRQLEHRPEAQIFLATDSGNVVQACRARYGKRLLTTDALRSDYGEYHMRGRNKRVTNFPGYRMGEEVIIDAYLLASTQVLVHGSSSVSNTVLCMNSTLSHDHVFKDIHIPTWQWRAYKHIKIIPRRKNRVRKILRPTIQR